MSKGYLIKITLLLSIFLNVNSYAEGYDSTMSKTEIKVVAKEAYLFGLPAQLWEKQFYRINYATAPKGLAAPMGQFGHSRQFVDASNRIVVGLNVDNLYSFAGLDLKEEPFVMSVPAIEDRYWIVQLINAWNDVPAAPGSRTRQGKAGDFLIVGPNWEGTVPEGLELLRSETNLTCLCSRIFCEGESDYEIVNYYQDNLTLTPLSEWGTNYTPPAEVPLPKVAFPADVNESVKAMNAEQNYGNLNRLLADNPPYDEDAEMLAKMKKIGIEAGATFSLNNFSKEEAQAIEEGYAEGYKKLMRIVADLGTIKNGWTLTYDMGRLGSKYDLRAG